jgi:hypothetical protein
LELCGRAAENFEQGIEMSSPTIYESDFVASDMTIQSGQTQSNNARNPSAVAKAGHRDLVVFTGTHKTGSTALHRYLAANRQVLAGLGVRYEITGFERGFSGNGQLLFDMLFLRQPISAEIDKKLEEYLIGSERAICSTEDFTRFGVREWEQLSAAFLRLGIRPRFLTFVRNVSSFYSSGHSEMAKAGLTSKSFAEFCTSNHYAYVMRSLKSIAEIFGTAAMSVCHYDSIASAIERPLLELLGLKSTQLDRSVLTQRTNRSLIDRELDLILRMNAATGGYHAAELTQLFMGGRSEVRRRVQLVPAVLATLEARHGKDVEWANRTFFGGEDILRVSAANLVPEGESKIDRQLKIEIDNDFVAWCLKRMSSNHQQGVTFVSSRLKSIDWVNSHHASIPENFDPVAYLILNVDLLNSQAKPFEHYILHGQSERRRMSW